MTQDDMNILVPEKLRELERTHRITILFACEHGSRSWGLNSPHSDFDVRFVYVREKSEYLRVFGAHEAITIPIDETWDVTGWDVVRFLRFLSASKALVYECLASGVRYVDKNFSWKIAPLLREYFSWKKMLFDYVEIVKHNRLERRQTLFTKHYFYMLRPLLAGLWVNEKKSPAPVTFAPLRVMLPENLQCHVDKLIDQRINLPEKTEIARVSELDSFMYGAFDSLKEVVKGYYVDNNRYPAAKWESLNKFFMEMLESYER